VTTLLGEVVYERAYYHCPHCHQGEFPSDAAFGLEHKQSAGAREVLSMAGALTSFEEAARDVVTRMTGLVVSASTLQRTAESVGTDIAERRQAGETIGPAAEWDWHRDAAGQRVAYVSADATGLLQQGPHAEKAEGRMPWVGCVFNPQPTTAKTRDRRVWERRYVAGLMPQAELAGELRAECRAVGIQRADVAVALTDGGAGLEETLLTTLAGLVQCLVFILDYFHVCEHLQEFAQLFVADPAARTAQMARWKELLKTSGGQELYRELQSLDVGDGPESVRESHRKLMNYVRTNLHRMDYPQYIARGWQIGSGMIESACKTVVGQRMKGRGMRWRERGSTALCQLRAVYRSEPAVWRRYWTPAAAT
jgi:hypothetical protein